MQVNMDKRKQLLQISVTFLTCIKMFCLKHLKLSHLFVNKLSRVLLHVTLVQVGGHVHQADFRQAEVCQLDVAHGCY